MLIAPLSARAQFESLVSLPEDESSDSGFIGDCTAILGLSADQVSAMKELSKAHEAEMAALEKSERRQWRKLADDAEDNPDVAAYQAKCADMNAKNERRRAELERAYKDDVRAILTPAQASRYPMVEVAQRRHEALGDGDLAGERIDLIELVRRVRTPRPYSAELTQLLDRYATELDAEIAAKKKAYEKFVQKSQEEQRQLAESGEQESDRYEWRWKEARKLGQGIVSVNARFATLIAGLLPTDARTRFDNEFRRDRFAPIYQQSRAIATIQRAEDLADISPEVKTKIAEHLKDYLAAAKPINLAIERAMSKAESGGEDIPHHFRYAHHPMAVLGNDEVSKAWKARMKLDRLTTRAVEALLTETQLDEMPDRWDTGFDASRLTKFSETTAMEPKSAPDAPRVIGSKRSGR